MTAEQVHEAPATSPEHHYVVGRDGHVWFQCTSPEDAPCRMQCVRDECREEGCRCDDPQLRPLGYCNVQEWISGDGVEWCTADFRIPVTTEWADDGYRWRPAQEQPTGGVLAEVAAERIRQHAKWGEQNYPDGTDQERIAVLRQPPAKCAEIMRLQVDYDVRRGASNYASILLEEVFEALAETDPAALRREVLQVAAVAVQWVEAIDRRTTASVS